MKTTEGIESEIQRTLDLTQFISRVRLPVDFADRTIDRWHSVQQRRFRTPSLESRSILTKLIHVLQGPRFVLTSVLVLIIFNGLLLYTLQRSRNQYTGTTIAALVDDYKLNDNTLSLFMDNGNE